MSVDSKSTKGQINLRYEPAFIEAFTKLATKRGLTVHAFIRSLIEKELKRAV